MFTLNRNECSRCSRIGVHDGPEYAFKAKVALTAIQGELTMAEMVEKFDVHANQITEWKKQLLSGAQEVFGSSANLSEESEQAIQTLHAKIGQLTVENDFLERG
ncbi:MAG: hypothetical protein GY732_17945, partial [Gammaproteobacteria bacterium]|nr:hypothetical protein [Gammaproteobacteria bacterium]